jgi:2,4-dienoyl-CoA reductase-like NADH-dependent reductase (Old Yellow Enzyme family)
MSKEARYSPILPLKLTDRCGQTQKLQDLVVPKEMTLLNIIHAKQICLRRRKFYSGFDDVELHAANGYLLENSYRL